jgi:hypothetical protein
MAKPWKLEGLGSVEVVSPERRRAQATGVCLGGFYDLSSKWSTSPVLNRGKAATQPVTTQVTDEDLLTQSNQWKGPWPERYAIVHLGTFNEWA